MADVHDLLASLRAEGRVDSRGAFTLDRDKALEKMQRFQLADPLHYLLLLVAAAHKRGATYVDFTIDTNDVRLAFDGAPLSRADLDQLFDSLLARADDQPARRELALALNAALALNPAHVRLESGDGRDTVGLTLTTAGADSPDGAAPPTLTFDTPDTRKDTPAGTRVHVRDRFSWRALVEFFEHVTRGVAETRLLTARCRYADLPIRVNGRDVAHGLALPEATASASLSRGDTAVVVGLVEPRDPQDLPPLPRVRWVVDQVLVAEDGLDLRFLPGLVAVVRCDALARDASLAAIVQDDRWRDALTVVVDAQNALLRQLRATLDDASVLGDRAGLDADRALSAALGRHTDDHPRALLAALCRHLAPRNVDLFDDALPFAAELRAAPVWRSAIQPGGETGSPAWLALSDLAPDGAAPDAIPFVSEPFTLAPDDAGPTLLLLTAEDARRVPFGRRRLVDVTPRFRATAAREQRRLAFLARRGYPLVPPGPETPVVTPFRVGAIHGELAVLLAPSSPVGETSVVSWYTDSCSLGSDRLNLPFPPLHLAVEAPLNPDDDYLRPLPDDAWAGAWAAIVAALPDLAAEVARRLARDEPLAETSRGLREWLVALLAALVDPELGVRLAESLGAALPAAPPPLTPEALLDRGLPYVRAPLFRLTDGRTTTSLGALSRAVSGPHADRDHVACVDPALPPLPDQAAPAVYASLAELRLLAAAVGLDRLRDATDDHIFERSRRAFLEQPTAPFAVTGCAVAITHAAPTGPVLLGVPDTGPWFDLAEPDADLPVAVALHRDDRRLATLSLPLAAHAPVAAAADAAGLRPTPTWDGVVRDDAFDAFTASLAEGLVALTVAACDHLAQHPDSPALRRWLHARLVALFPSTRLTLAYATLRAATPDDPDAADTVYDGLLRRAVADPNGASVALRSASRSRDELDGLAAIARGAPDLELRARRLVRDASGRLQPLTALVAAPLFDRWHGQGRAEPTPFASVLDEIAATGGVDHVPHALADALLDAPWLILDGPARRAMTRLLDAQRLRAAVSRVHDARFRAAFLHAPARSTTFADDEALVTAAVDHGGVTGHVALPPTPPSRDSGRYTVDAHLHGRPLATRSGTWPHPDVVARVDLAPRLVAMNREWTRGDFEDAPVLAALEAALPRLFDALRGAWPLLRERPSARAHLLDFVARNAQRARPLGRDVDAALRSLPTLPGLDGRWHSLSDLLTRRAAPGDGDGGACLYVTAAPVGVEDLPRPSAYFELANRPVLILDRESAKRLWTLVPKLTEVSQRVQVAITSARAQRDAPDLPPPDARPRLATGRVDGGLLRGEVFVVAAPTERPRVAIGAWGKRITEAIASPLYPVSGVVTVPGGLVGPRFDAVLLGTPQRDTLEIAARGACRDLLARFPTLDADARDAARRWLLGVAKALSTAASLGDADRAVLQAIEGLPLVDHPRWKTLAEVAAAGRSRADACDTDAHRARHVDQPPVTLAPPSGALAVSFGDGDGRTSGWLAVHEAILPWAVDQAIAGEPTARLTFARDRRPLGARAFDLPAGPVEGLVDDDRLTPTLRYDGVLDDEALGDALATVRAALAPLTRRVADAFAAGRAELRGWLLATFAADAAGALDDVLADVALFDLVGRPERATCAAVRDVAAREGKVPCVVDPPVVTAPPSRELLAVDVTALAALMRRFGSDGVEDAGAWLATELRRTALLERTQVERVALRAPTLVRVALAPGPDADAAPRGEVGLSAVSATESRLDGYRDRRPVGTVTGFSSYGLVAALDHPELSPTDDLSGVLADRALSACVDAAVSRHDELVVALAARFGPDAAEPLPRSERRVAVLHLLRWLARTRDDRGHGAAARDKPLITAPGVLETADGRRVSIAMAVADSAKHRGLAVLPAAPREALPADLRASRLVVLCESRDLPLLERVVGRTIDYRDGWRDEVVAARNRARLPALPEADRPDALASTRIGRTDLEGQLHVLANGRPGVAIGRDGLELARLPGPDGLAVWGVLTGEAVEVAPRWEGATLTSEAQAAVERAALKLYTTLAERYDVAGSWGDAEREAARRALRDALGGLTARAREHSAPRTARSLLQRVARLPLLFTRDGARLSLQQLGLLGYTDDDAVRVDRRVSGRAWSAPRPVAAPDGLVTERGGRRALAFDLGRAAAPERAGASAARPSVGVSRVTARVATSARTRTNLLLSVSYRGEAIGEATPPFPLGPLDVEVDGDLVIPAPDWSRVADGDPGVDTVRRELHARIGPLLLDAVTSLDGAAHEALALSLLESFFPAPTFGRLLVRLVAARGEDEGRAAFVEALATFAGRSVMDLHQLLIPALDARAPIEPSSLAARVRLAADPLSDGVVAPVPGADAAARRALLDAALAAPLIPPLRSGWRLLARSRADNTALGSLVATSARGEAIAYAERDLDLDPSADWHVIDLREPRLKHLVQRAVGREALEDARVWVTRRERERAFLARPVEAARLAAREAILARPLAGEGFSGEIGLARLDDAGALTPFVALLRQGRLLESTRAATPTAVVARVNADGLAPDGLWSRAEDDALRGRILAACRDAAPGLVLEVAERFPALSGEDREAAWVHVLDALARGGALAGRLEAEPEARRLAAVPGFRGAEGGEVSAAQLVEVEGRLGAVYVMGATPARAAPGEAERRVVVASRAERRRMEALFASVVDHSQAWAEASARHGRLSEAPPMPDLRTPGQGVDALVSSMVNRGGIRGVVYLPRQDEPLTVAIGVRGRIVGAYVAPSPFPVAGAVAGGAVEAAADLSEVSLPEGARRTIAGAAREVYKRALRRFEREGWPGAQATRARELLRDALLALHAAPREGLSPEDRRLYRRLAAAPLMTLSDGRALTLEQALALRPAELADLGLWGAGGADGANLVGRARHLALVLSEEVSRDRARSIPPERFNVEAPKVKSDRVASFVAEEGPRAGIWLFASHPLVAAALETPDDPVLLVMLASAVGTALEDAGQPGHGDAKAQARLIRRAAKHFAATPT